jgi:hypothetical protein
MLSNKELENYMQHKMQARKSIYRVKLGMQRMICNPVYILGVVVLIILFGATWHYRYILQMNIITGVIADIYRKFVDGAIILMFLLLLLLYISQIGELIARRYEGKMMVVFSSRELRGGHPILTSYKRDQKTKAMELTFFTMIPKQAWEDHKEDIADILNSRFIQDIEYGGKHKDNGNLINLFMMKGRVAKERGEAYDDEL